MDMATRPLLFFLILTLFSFHASGDPKYISMPLASGEEVIHNRHLLQVLTPCSINFQVQNYTIITSECKGPSYAQNACCTAFVKFACPFASEINDNTTDCANNMFTYISIYGRYPAGLFANECVGDARGLPCPATNASAPAPPNSAPARLQAFSSRALWWIISIISTIVLFDLYGREWVN
eukprot:c16920_g1_i1 orf=318-857(+)